MKIKVSPEDFVVDEVIDLKLDVNGSFSYFVLRKRDYSTEDAVRFISNRLNIDRKRINYCGAKDKIAVTSQYISIQQLNKEKRVDYDFDEIKFEYVGQGDTRLTLGSHIGNKFVIIVRETPKDFQSKNPDKVLNIFGPQRFSKNNAEVGEAIIKKDFKKATEIISEGEGRYEREVRDFLSVSPNNYVTALRKVPFKILTMFIHAYQSKLFNELVSNWGGEKVPLIGFSTDQDLVKDILEQENISTRDFIIRAFPDLTAEGDFRDKYMSIKDFSSKKLEEDVWSFSFFLGKGSYATVLINWLFNN